MTHVLRARHVSRFDGSRPVLRDVCLTLQQGEVTCVLGHVGSGRTALLRCLSLLDPIDGGFIEFGGHRVLEGDDVARDRKSRMAEAARAAVLARKDAKRRAKGKAPANGTNGHANGTNGHAIDTNGHANGTNGHANGTNGRANGTNGRANGTNGRANGTNGHANGTNGHTNGTNGHATPVATDAPRFEARPPSRLAGVWPRRRRCHALCDLAHVRRHIGVVFQHDNLCPNRTVLQNLIEGPVHVLGMKKPEAAESAIELLRLFDAEKLASAYPPDLPRVERRLASLARALVMRPELLLVDDITVGLEPAESLRLLRAVQAMHEIRGTAVVLVTHHLDHARTIADRVCLMEDGTIAEQGPAGRLDDPQTDELRAYLASVRATV